MIMIKGAKEYKVGDKVYFQLSGNYSGSHIERAEGTVLEILSNGYVVSAFDRKYAVRFEDLRSATPPTIIKGEAVTLDDWTDISW